MEDYKNKYEQALYNFKKIKAANKDNKELIDFIEYNYPELKESEDERVRKALIELVRMIDNNSIGQIFGYGDIKYSDMITWLENQGEQKSQGKPVLEVWKDMRFEVYQQASGNRHEPNYSDDSTKMFSLTDIDEIFEKIAEKQDEQKSADKVEPKFKVGDTIVEKDFDEIGCGTIVNIKDGKYIFDDGCYIEIKEQGLWQLVEQKPTEKVEPKFKVGDWVVVGDWEECDDKISCHIDNLYQGKESLMYTITDIHNMTRSYSVKCFDNNANLWTIQDAKDGDVLADSLPFIFKRIDSLQRSYAYCGISLDYSFRVESEGELGEWTWDEDIKPATKEQRDLLFQKMKEAGYEWDAEKKELKKIEQKPTNKVEPKFKIDDWIINSAGMLRHILTVDKTGYQTDYGWLTHDIYDNTYHLWTIQDAKDGDVLANKNGAIFINAGSDESGVVLDSYCYISVQGEFYIVEPKTHSWFYKDEIKPATKEQCDLLFSKMKEAGYEWDVEKKELNKIEQKPTDKNEPKFKIEEGKWYVCISQFCNCIEGRAYKAISDNRIMDDFGTEYDMHSNAYKYFRLWTIQDAKDGDVLSFSDKTIVIFKDLYNATTFHSYCHIEDDTFGISKDGMPDWWNGKGFHPATKEQCDILFTKMKEAGYEWDSENKELKKIEQKHNEDCCKISDDITIEEKDMNEYNKGFECGKQRVLKYPEDFNLCEKSASTWSEEDEKAIDSILNDLRQGVIPDEEDIQWLKSLKEIMKGGEE